MLCPILGSLVVAAPAAASPPARPETVSVGADVMLTEQTYAEHVRTEAVSIAAAYRVRSVVVDVELVALHATVTSEGESDSVSGLANPQLVARYWRPIRDWLAVAAGVGLALAVDDGAAKAYASSAESPRRPAMFTRSTAAPVVVDARYEDHGTLANLEIGAVAAGGGLDTVRVAAAASHRRGMFAGAVEIDMLVARAGSTATVNDDTTYHSYFGVELSLAAAVGPGLVHALVWKPFGYGQRDALYEAVGAGVGYTATW